jgi:hypothetical protein
MKPRIIELIGLIEKYTQQLKDTLDLRIAPRAQNPAAERYSAGWRCGSSNP